MDGKFRFIIDDDGCILAGERKFFATDIAGSDFQRVGRKMRPVDGRFAGRFAHLLRCTVPSSTLIPKANDCGHWVCRVGPFGTEPERGSVRLARPTVALTIHATGTGRHAQWADLRGAFNLTRSEDRVLKMLISGQSVTAIAAKEAVSVNTVRTHVRHIHEKLEIGDAHELWLRVMDYRLL